MSHRPTTARQLRELLVHRIASGQYGIGAQLPGTRELAADIGANRNTVAKVYGELARDGLLQIVHGKGAFVVRSVTETSCQQPAEQVAQVLDDAFSRARLFGLSKDDVLRLTDERLRAIYDEGTPRLAFVECNPYDAQLVAGELATQLDIQVVSKLIAELPTSGPVPLDIAATSYFHLEEVERLLQPRGIRVVGVNTLPDPGALLALARLQAGTKVGVVANNEAGVERFSMLVRTYCRAEIQAMVMPSDRSVDDLALWADVLVSSLSCAGHVKQRAHGKPAIVLAFHVDPQSVQYLRTNVLAPATDSGTRAAHNGTPAAAPA
jgi:DNA-binding transcriptional regulator YhcF (GntR family)